MIRFLNPYFLIAFLPILAASLFLILLKRRYPILRAVALVLAVLAAASPFLVQQTLSHNVFFLIDRSASVTLATDDDDVRTRIQQVMDTSPDARFGVIEFAKTAVVSAPVGMPILPLGMTSLDESETNLRAATDLGLSIVPQGQSHQFVLVSDGHFSDLIEQPLSLVQLSGIPISVIPVGRHVPADVALSALSAPAVVQVGRPFSIDVEIAAQQDGPVRFILYRDNDIVTIQDLDVNAGTTEISVTDEMDRLGSSVYQAIVKGSDDPIPANDDLSMLVSSTEMPRVLLVDRLDTSYVSGLLDSLGVSYITARAIPPLEVLSDYRQLILASGKLENYTLTDIETVDHFARQLGGGVLLVNGEHEVRGFSSGGIEELLPVTFDIPEKTERASLAIVYLLDRSASMKSRVDGVEKIDVLKEAAVASINLLGEETMVGIIAFDRVYDWVFPIALIDFSAIIDALQPMDAIGGTDIYFPLVDALDHLEQVEARSKHILLISDGKTGDEVRDYPGLVRRLNSSSDTTLSAIAVGNTPNIALLGALVTAGGGTLYLADDFSTLPQVSIRATQRLSRERFVTEETEVEGRLLSALPTDSVPALLGYVVSYPKKTAETLLWGGEDPLVSTWRVGLGSITVLNTDLSGAWSQGWFEWSDLPSLFEGILTTTEPEVAATLGMTTSVSFEGSTTSILVDTRNEAGAYVNFLDIEAKVLPTDSTYILTQVSPGLYHADLPTPAKGGYIIQIFDRTRNRSMSVPLSVPYSSEFADIGQDLAVLTWIAESSNGVVLGSGASLPESADRLTTQIRPLHGIFILAVLALFLLELVIRKWPVRKKSGQAAD
ncbi:MAG: VWA domain-containing protein [Candidatus Bipolaricaulota bacterium]